MCVCVEQEGGEQCLKVRLGLQLAVWEGENLGLDRGKEVSSMLGGQEEEVRLGLRDRTEQD